MVIRSYRDLVVFSFNLQNASKHEVIPELPGVFAGVAQSEVENSDVLKM